MLNKKGEQEIAEGGTKKGKNLKKTVENGTQKRSVGEMKGGRREKWGWFGGNTPRNQ